ncbi:metalloreductase Fre8 [Niveomyces insectorum RCEF 264]|uniref:Metalloreductase Fre8 n=1 Tax=Niveomyces insectorum RCEF 264 TaxID=1081102 RepID=A0A167S4F7_9HYPO|nr:metalloreductase Fre8 [Niveomyces insectorum RCEF 264]
MAWPYEFLELTDEEKDARRLVLDRYSHYAFLASLLPALLTFGVRAVLWAAAQVQARYGHLVGGRSSSNSGGVADGGAYAVIPDSPSLKSQRLTTTRGAWAARWRRAQWWLADDVVVWGQAYGQRDQWLAGAFWLVLMTALCVLETGRDYFHLTKRFGAVATAQFPVQYLLALKYANPLAAVFRSSHEQLNRWHRVLGGFVYVLLGLHAAFYTNYFLGHGGLLPRLVRPTVPTGLLAITAMTLMSTTALAVVRRASYRVFFVTHVLAAFSVPFLILFHTRHARYNMATALLLLIADLVLRKIHTVTTQATVAAIPGTDLVTLMAPLPHTALHRFRAHPGAHIYMGLPAAARTPGKVSSSPSLSWSYWLFEFLFNPFTVAAVNDSTNDVTLVVRTRRGPMTAALAKHAAAAAAAAGPTAVGTPSMPDTDNDDGDGDGAATPALATRHHPDAESPRAIGTLPVNIEGPYGAMASQFPTLTPRNVDRVLLVAGGVGATFLVPIYRALVAQAEDGDGSPGLPVDFVWSLRNANEATWAVAAAAAAAAAAAQVGADAGGRNLLADPNVHIFLTGGSLGSNLRNGTAAGHASAAETTTTAAAAAIELNALRRPPRSRSPRSQTRSAIGHIGDGRQRPDLRQVVDSVFRHGSEERVAVLVCGPAGMVRELRASVGVWVRKGRVVWWHNESFGW